MGILDSKLELSDAQDLSSMSSGSTAESTNVLNLGGSLTDGWGNSITPDIGEGEDLVLNVEVETAFTASGSTKVIVHVMTDTDATVTDGTELFQFDIPKAAAKGTKYAFPLPAGTISQYLGLKFEAAGATKTTAGKVNAYVSRDHQT